MLYVNAAKRPIYRVLRSGHLELEMKLNELARDYHIEVVSFAAASSPMGMATDLYTILELRVKTTVSYQNPNETKKEGEDELEETDVALGSYGEIGVKDIPTFSKRLGHRDKEEETARQGMEKEESPAQDGEAKPTDEQRVTPHPFLK